MSETHPINCFCITCVKAWIVKMFPDSIKENETIDMNKLMQNPKINKMMKQHFFLKDKI